MIAAQSSAGVKHVAISGLPASFETAAVYGERRTLPVSHGTLRDTFRQWQVHIYRINEPQAAPHLLPGMHDVHGYLGHRGNSAPPQAVRHVPFA